MDGADAPILTKKISEIIGTNGKKVDGDVNSRIKQLLKSDLILFMKYQH